MRSRRFLVFIALLCTLVLSTSATSTKADTYYVDITITDTGTCSNSNWNIPFFITWNVPPATVYLHRTERSGYDSFYNQTLATGYSGSGDGAGDFGQHGTFNLPEPYTYVLTMEYLVNGSTLSYNTIQINCSNDVATASISHVIPDASEYCGSDGRVAAQCWDRMAVYCNLDTVPQTLNIWGVGLDSQGFPLTTFVFSDIVKAGPKGITKNLGKLGNVSISVDDHNYFWLAWVGQVTVPSGSFYADGRPNDGYAKSFYCPIMR